MLAITIIQPLSMAPSMHCSMNYFLIVTIVEIHMLILVVCVSRHDAIEVVVCVSRHDAIEVFKI